MRACARDFLSTHGLAQNRMKELERRRGEREASVCSEILRWGRQKNLKLWWGKGAKDGSFLLRFETGSSIYHLVSAWTYGRVEIQFKLLSDEPPFTSTDRAKSGTDSLCRIPPYSGMTESGRQIRARLR